MRPEAEARDALVEVLRSPFREPLIDRLVEGHHPLRHVARGCDDDHHDDLRLEQEHLDVPDGRRLERGRRDERQQARQIGERLRGRLQRRLDFAPQRREIELEPRRTRLEPFEQLVDVQAVASLGRDPAGGGVGMGQEAQPFELRELVAHRRGGHQEA